MHCLKHLAINLQFYLLALSMLVGSVSQSQMAFRGLNTQEGDSMVYRTFCKQNIILRSKVQRGTLESGNGSSSLQSKQPFLSVHGNVQYNFNYQSLADTPFSGKSLAQHAVQTTFDLVAKGKYPLKLILSTRQSNSPYFDDISDAQVQFNREVFMKTIKENLLRSVPLEISHPSVETLERLRLQKLDEVNGLKAWLSNPVRMQVLVEEKERNLSFLQQRTGELPGLPSNMEERNKAINAELTARINFQKDQMEKRADSILASKTNMLNDSLSLSRAAAEYEQKKKTLEQAEKEWKAYEQQLSKSKKAIQDSLSRLRQEITRLNDAASFSEFMEKHQGKVKELPRGFKTLSAINTIGVGRSWVDYSELTVKNTSVTGFNIEANPSRYYAAFAAGRIDYRFRDYILKKSNQPHQSVYLLRAGVGKKGGNNFIVSFYDGKRNAINSYASIRASTGSERVIGISAESRLQLDARNYLVLEVAKSSFHRLTTAGGDEERLLKTLQDFKNHSNEAYSLKVNGYVRPTQTKISGYYRKMGPHFQSFNLLPSNVDQEAYLLKLQQELWNRKLTIEAGVRKNDFTNPFLSPGATSQTVFKSLQASLRIPRYPFVSIGYFPSTLLTILQDRTVVENQYSTFNVLVSHAYQAGRTSLSSSAVYLRYFNRGADTGFLYYNSANWIVNQFIYRGGFRLQTGMTWTNRGDLRLVTLEQSAGYQVKKWLMLQSGLKYNRLARSATMWGMSAGVGLQLNKLGSVQMNYEKSYLPGMQRKLLPFETGRVNYYRTF